SGCAAKLLMRTCPRTPCTPTTMPISTRRSGERSEVVIGAAISSRLQPRQAQLPARWLLQPAWRQLRPGPWRALLRLVATHRRRQHLGGMQEAMHAIGRLRANAQPMGDALLFQDHAI